MDRCGAETSVATPHMSLGAHRQRAVICPSASRFLLWWVAAPLAAVVPPPLPSPVPPLFVPSRWRGGGLAPWVGLWGAGACGAVVWGSLGGRAGLPPVRAGSLFGREANGQRP